MLKSSVIAYFRTFVFGVEDSLVSTVGLLSGIAIAGMGAKQIFVTGIVLIFVEAISMAAGSFLSESSAEEYATRSERISERTYVSALIMFASYVISGFVPLLPYLFLPPSGAFAVSIILSFLFLGILGVLSARLSKTHVATSVFRMVLIGGVAIAVGVGVGKMLG